MNAVEKIEAAITKLEGLKSDATPGPWRDGDGGGYVVADTVPPSFFSKVGWVIGDANMMADSELIVTLHRTIDAQLALLRTEHEMCSVLFAGMTSNPDERILALAEAILGEVSS